MTTDQLRRFFEEPGAHLLLDLDFMVLDAGPEYLRTTYTRREDIVGKSVLEIVDDSTHKEYNGSLRQSLARVVQTRQPDKMPPQRYAVLKRTGEGDRTEHSPRWLRVTNIPIFEHDEMTSIVQRIEDVTLEYETARTVAGLRRRSNVFYATVVGLFVAFALGLTIAVDHSDNASRQAQTAAAQVQAQGHASCVIQARGLAAGHALTNVMLDIFTLLRLPPTKVERAQQRRQPTPPSTLRLLKTLDASLALYVRLENQQPHARSCVTK